MKQSGKKKKIAVIGLRGLPAFGGAAAVGENIIDQLKDKYEFTVLSVSSHTPKNNNNYNGVNQVVFNKCGKGGINTFIYFIKCLVHVLFNKYDLIHLHHASSGYITPFLSLKYKIVLTLHGTYQLEDTKYSSFFNIFFRYFQKLNIKYANKIISVSKYDADYIMKKYNKEIDYIPNGIKIVNFESKRLMSSDKYIMFAAGRIYDIKGLHLLLKALQKSKHKVKLLVAGDLNQVLDYKDEILSLSKNIDVQFLSLIKEKEILFSYISNAELFVFPSIKEAMSMMLLEVVSVKTPVIASDIPANTNVFNEDEVLFFRNNDVEDLTNKLNFAFNNLDIMTIKSKNAYDKLKESYTWEQIAEKYDMVYKKLL